MTRPKYSPQNERIKHSYLRYLAGPRRLAEASVDQVAAALADYERANEFKDFRTFRKEHAERYQRYLTDVSPTTGKSLSKATISSRLAALKAFFQWVSRVPGYRKLNYSDFDYFNNSAKDERIAKAVRLRPNPSVEQILHVVSTMPAGTDIEKRNRALIAFTLLSGARDDAIASMSLKHIDLEKRKVHQDAREVRTKNAKTFTSDFFPVPAELGTIVADWIEHLRCALLWGPDDPLFPMSKIGLNDDGVFANQGLDRKHWSTASPIREIFKEAFTAAGLPYYNPHSFRNTLAILGEKVCPDPEAFKAWSQNLGHTHVLTTFTSYGTVPAHRQEQILASLVSNKSISAPSAETVSQHQIERLDQAISDLQGLAQRLGKAGG